ncbi:MULTISPECIES: tetratricopeptide repeat protein [unclassified Phenylobacterium]|uniref:tetratricopeptide repeat protein n=1 Tax=unclassified Phenylobacterium TaxID=2640670 RepID=UPI000B0AAFB0|nr:MULTISPECIES: tetratricopeptide repeat protein [unclassified Phenylobacterium]
MAVFDESAAGDAAAPEKLARLSADIASATAMREALKALQVALTHAHENRFAEACTFAEEALTHDPSLVFGWHLLGIGRDKLNQRSQALDAYERAFALSPADPDIAHDLGRLAFKMDMLPQAEALFRHCLSYKIGAREPSNNLGALLRRQMRFDEAIEVLRLALMAEPEAPMLWLTLGTIVGDKGDIDQAEIFYSEALRLDPSYAKAHYNLANILFTKHRHDEALSHCHKAIELSDVPEDSSMMRFALSTMLLARSELTQGWAYYDARLEPTYAEPIHFVVDRPRWTPGTSIAGRHLMLFGEQGLGDEILFANVLDDVLADLGPEGRLTVAVTDRLLPFFQRSFPSVTFGSHATLKGSGRAFRGAQFIKDWSDIDLWAPLGAMLKSYRGAISQFPDRPKGYMKADPSRAQHWRNTLAHLPGLKVGVLWTSLVIDSSRHLYFSPFEDWRAVLQTPGVSFVNLQYGDQSEAIAHARDAFGVEIHQPPGIDLRNDLDDVAALSGALDLVIGFSNASFNIAAASGTPAWLIAVETAWTRLGTDHYPWYSQVRTYAPATHGDWAAVMAKVAEDLTQEAARGTGVAATG